MRAILAGLALLSLAACGGGDTAATKTSAAADAASAASATAPAVVSADPNRAAKLNECRQDVAKELPEGADLNAFCACAVDAMDAGQEERPAMEACATKLGIKPKD